MRNWVFIPYEPQYAHETIRMWRESKERAIGQKEIHDLDGHLYFLNHILADRFQIELAIVDGKVAGMIAYNEREVNQLYIHVDYQGMGIGQSLLEKAKVLCSGRLTLSTFEVNEKARRFYERNGFEVIGRGCENEENLPDIQYEWTVPLHNEGT